MLILRISTVTRTGASCAWVVEAVTRRGTSSGSGLKAGVFSIFRRRWCRHARAIRGVKRAVPVSDESLIEGEHRVFVAIATDDGRSFCLVFFCHYSVGEQAPLAFASSSSEDDVDLSS